MGGFATRRPDAFAWRRFWRGAVLLVPLAAFSGAYSLAVATDTHQPEVSQQVYGELPRAKARLADLQIARAVSDNAAELSARSAGGIAESLPQSTRLTIETQALSALIDTPYMPQALRQLALVERDAERRRELLLLARRTSRRDVSAAAQLAELQFADRDYEAGLATLEQALDISEALDAQIFPLMLRASQSGEFAGLLRSSLERDPVWAERLADHASKEAASAPYFARLAGSLPPQSRALSLDYGAPLVRGLVAAGRHDEAFTAYRAYSGSAPQISAFGTRPLAPIDWQLSDNIETGARLIGSRGDAQTGVAEIFAEARRSGEAARIVTRLRPGAYELELGLADLQGAGGSLQLSRICLSGQSETGEVATGRPLSQGAMALRFSVPEDCPYQSLRLSVAAAGERVSVLVSRVNLGPAL